MRCLLAERNVPATEWAQFLPHVALAINSSVAAATGKSPHQLLYGEDVALPVGHVVQAPRPNLSAEEAARRAVDWSALATRAVARAGQQAAAQANKHRQEATFAPDDLVLLSSRHLSVEGSRKLSQRWMGPFRVLKAAGPVAYRLELPARWQGVHPVFHASLLRPWRGKTPALPPPVLVDGSEEFEVDHIVAHRETRRGRRYRVRWKGYGPEEDTALWEEDLVNAP